MPSDVQQTVFELIGTFLRERKNAEIAPSAHSRLVEELDLDSLDLAELSVALEDEFGRDPFSEGMLPETVGEVVAYYE